MLLIAKKRLGKLIGREMSESQRKKNLKQIWIGDQELNSITINKDEDSVISEEVYLAKKPIQLE